RDTSVHSVVIELPATTSHFLWLLFVAGTPGSAVGDSGTNRAFAIRSAKRAVALGRFVDRPGHLQLHRASSHDCECAMVHDPLNGACLCFLAGCRRNVDAIHGARE